MIEASLYRHYKGGMYKVIGVAKHSETMEDLVVYESLNPEHEFKLWVRPAKMFTEKVKIDGKLIKRFKKIEEKC
ncbi:MAG TPA: DUF1653 domain-containing protein [Candidatus Saccharimonadales bacterium]|nr:DUF1653 domain-containing protein [Candidatus Saccharimonadales bacterium]